ncbi:MAG: STAS domain-containing protein [Pseudomonadota bacterium]
MTNPSSQAPPETADSTAEWPVLRLVGNLTINEAEERQLEWLEALHQQDRLTLDCRDLDRVDVAGIQLLLALRVSAIQAGKPLRLIAASTSLLRLALASAGLCKKSPDDPGTGMADDLFCLLTR